MCGCVGVCMCVCYRVCVCNVVSLCVPFFIISSQSRVTVVYSSDTLDSFIYIPDSEYNFELTTQKIVTKAIEPGLTGIVLILM